MTRQYIKVIWSEPEILYDLSEWCITADEQKFRK